MKKKLTNNVGLKILSILFAFLLWLVVVSVDDPVTTKPFSSIPVELINTQAVTGQGSVYEVLDNSDMASIHVTAKRSVLDSLSRDNFKATADMTRMDGNLVPIEVKAKSAQAKSAQTVLNHPEKYQVKNIIKFGDYNVGRNGKLLTLPNYMQFLLDLEPEQIILKQIDIDEVNAMAKEILNR